MNNQRLNIEYFLPAVFLICFGLLPLINLLWQVDLGIIKGNWLLYPFFIIAIAIYTTLRNKISQEFGLLLLVAFFYSVWFYFSGGHFESIVRFFFSLAPFAFLDLIRNNQSRRSFNFFISIYLISISIPIVISFLQLTGRYPYYEFDTIGDEWTGRISGGYNKPNNFIAILFPVFLLGIYYFYLAGRKWVGSFLIIGVLVMVYITHLRTAMIIFFVILVLGLKPSLTWKIVIFYYRYYLNLVIGLIVLIFFGILYQMKGTVEGLRGRFAMWEAHGFEFLYGSTFLEIIFGKNEIKLPDSYLSDRLIGSLEEAHNNSFRTIILFGIVGFFFYCYFIRRLVFRVAAFKVTARMKFIYFSCFIFLILYSITNEVAYYSSVLWSVLIWIFLIPLDQKQNVIQEFKKDELEA